MRRPLSMPAVLALTAALALAPSPAAAQEACGGDLVQQVQETYQALSSFTARFEQTDHRPDGRVVEAGGTVAYLKPGRMRWEYEPPNEQLLVTDGETVWLYDPLLDNVTVQPLAELTQGTPLAFLLGAGNLEQDFRCRAHTREPPDDGLTYLELVPREPIPTLDFIQLGVAPGTARIAALRMFDSQGNLRAIRFRGLKTDVDLSPERFTFEVEPGMEVITKEGGDTR